MYPNENTDYNPAEDENQGVITKLVQGENGTNGVSQLNYMNSVTNQGPEPVKEEVNDADANGGVNDGLLAEEDVENGDITETADDH